MSEVRIVKHINRFNTSNTYLLYTEGSPEVWIIDPGDASFVLDWLTEYRKEPAGIFVTHSHIDHIYGINSIREYYPLLSVYVSEDGKSGLLSSKLNLSYYHKRPYVVKDENLVVLTENGEVMLWNDVMLKVHATPGHNTESLSFQIGGHLFTGDALIPGVKVFTKFHGGNKLQAKETIDRIFSLFSGEQMIWPGHGEECKLENIKKEHLI